MGEKVRSKTVEVRILKGGDEAIVISESAGDEITWTAEMDGIEYDIRFPNGTPFKDGSGQPKDRFKARKMNPERTGKGHFNRGGGNEYHYEIRESQKPAVKGLIPPGDQPTSGTLLKDPIVIVDP